MAPTSVKEAKRTFDNIKKVASKLRGVETVICPPSLYLGELRRNVTGHRCTIGAQNVFWEKEGAFTGEISTAQLVDLKIEYVIIGHSERRAMGETDEEVNKKILAALKAKLKVIVCVGESHRDEDGEYTRFISEQIKSALAGVSRSGLSDITIAYEPIWAIGKDALRPASAHDVEEVSILISKVIADIYGNHHDPHTQILYGGSVDDRNAREFLASGSVAGLLVGRASLRPQAFTKILEIAEEVAKGAATK